MKKALWLVKLLQQSGPLSKKQILQAWCSKDDKGRPMPVSTFYDNKRAAEQHLGIIITCKGGMYHIQHQPTEIDPLMSQILENQNVDDLTQSTADLTLVLCRQIMEAIELRQRICFQYASTHRPKYTTMFDPYCVRSIRGYIYTVGFSHKHNEVRTFAIDRIQSISLLPSHYCLPSTFNSTDYFRNSFGAFAGKDIHSQRILLQVSAATATYLKQRPLHESQREISVKALSKEIQTVATHQCFATPTPTCSADTTSTWIVLEIRVGITRDLVAEILSHGPEMRVLYPSDLAKHVQELHQRAAQQK